MSKTYSKPAKCCDKPDVKYKMTDAICTNCGMQFKVYDESEGFVLKKVQTKNDFKEPRFIQTQNPVTKKYVKIDRVKGTIKTKVYKGAFKNVPII